MNYINFIESFIFSSKTDHRRYDLDLQEASGEDSKSRRIALAVIPFVALYRPAGAVISWGMGSCRVISNLRSLAHEEKQEWKSISKKIAQTTLAVVSLSSNILNVRVGQLVTSSIDTTQGAYSIIYYTLEGRIS